MSLVCGVLILSVLGQTGYAQKLRAPRAFGYTVYRQQEGAWGGIYTRAMGRGRTIVLQVYDLRRCSMDVLLFGIRDMGCWDGRYDEERVNPHFRKAEAESAYVLYKDMHRGKVLSVTNGVFFEAPRESAFTQLAFPVIFGGTLVSAGGSPNGPDPVKYPLRVLKIGDSAVMMGRYDGARSSSLERFPSQLVTLHYRSHPNLKEFPAIEGGYRSTYHLVTAVGGERTGGRQTVVLISSNYRLSILVLAQELKRVCPTVADDDILTLDGGSSICILDCTGREVIRGGEHVSVPLFLGFRLRGASMPETARIMNPRPDDVVDRTRPYFIFSSANVDRIELFRNELPLAILQELPERRFDGLCVWNPEGCPPGSGYRLKLRSSAGVETYSGSFSIGP